MIHKSINLPKSLWDDLVRVARRHKQKPENLAEKALRDFLRREADEELFARSQTAARRSRFRTERPKRSSASTATGRRTRARPKIPNPGCPGHQRLCSSPQASPAISTSPPFRKKPRATGAIFGVIKNHGHTNEQEDHSTEGRK